MTVRFLSLILLGGLVVNGCMSRSEAWVYERSYIGLGKEDVLLSWSRCWLEWNEVEYLPWPTIWLYAREEPLNTNHVKHVDAWFLRLPMPRVDENSVLGKVHEAVHEAVISRSARWDSFETRLPDWNPFDFRRKRKRLAVWFDDKGVATNQCVIVYDYYDS